MPYTATDLAELPSGSISWELDCGRIIPVLPRDDRHGAVEARLVVELGAQGSGGGRVRCGGAGVVLWRNPDRVVGADAVFVANASLPIRRSPEGYLETIPDLVVEVVSKNDRPAEVARKVADYLHAGVRVVWVADPTPQTITEHRSNQEPRVMRGDDALTVEDVIPGFRLRVGDVFVE
ncbi:MAG: Uma2 family endonuclease [Actinomycetota bacterium]